MGLASYLLIGFWYKKPAANAAAIKAFVVNRIGDFGFALGIITVFWMSGTVDFDTDLRRRRRRSTGKTIPLFALELSTRRPCLPAAVRRRHGQVGAVPPAHLAARRDGRPDPGLGADPRRHHGHGRRLHGRAAVAAVRAAPTRADVRHRHRRAPPRSSPPPSAWRRTTSSGSSPIRPARSSATCSSPWASAPIRSACSTSSPTPSSRRCCSWAPAR